MFFIEFVKYLLLQVANLCVESEFTDAQATAVLRNLKDKHVDPTNIRFNSATAMRAHIRRNAESELVHKISLRKYQRDGRDACI